jgi:hypothetical protein
MPSSAVLLEVSPTLYPQPPTPNARRCNRCQSCDVLGAVILTRMFSSSPPPQDSLGVTVASVTAPPKSATSGRAFTWRAQKSLSIYLTECWRSNPPSPPIPSVRRVTLHLYPSRPYTVSRCICINPVRAPCHVASVPIPSVHGVTWHPHPSRPQTVSRSGSRCIPIHSVRAPCHVASVPTVSRCIPIHSVKRVTLHLYPSRPYSVSCCCIHTNGMLTTHTHGC